ncbi:lysylphosphatidylglycerol synthase transmembrane domain-containing protein [Desertimonas flava]|uniref:lysylphosphatidylglycerol synthase transmembrane domain-containing protein n=1 Tax=Desertimonas flava TaxID=2064846 RepID=UPI000E355136|nr:lysylphosphatidylglycerol synthase transmembrane domain-containing protein [Desertimonas flava]
MSARSEHNRRIAPPEWVSGDLPPIVRDPSEPVERKKKFKPLRFGIKTVGFLLAANFFVLPILPRFRDAAENLTKVEPLLLVLGLALQVGAWSAYSLLTRAALGEAGKTISHMRMFRIQMSSKALTLIVPGGNAAGGALGYRLLTLSGIRGADAGFAMATAGVGSALVLNIIFWGAVLVSIPSRGVNGLYATAALVGVVTMFVVAMLVLGLMHGQGRAERIVRRIAAKFRLSGDKAVSVLRQIGSRVEELIDDRRLLKRVAGWAALAWLLDATSLWMFLRAYHDQAMDPDGLLVAFGLANVVASVPLTPGGLGYVDGVYVGSLVGFGMPRTPAGLGVASYRLAQWAFPIIVGAFFYLTLRVGPWSIARRERLKAMRELVRDAESTHESSMDFLMRAWPKRPVRRMPDVQIPVEDAEEAARAEAIEALESEQDPADT